MIKHLLSTILLGTIISAFSQQIYLNEKWVSVSGNIGEFNLSSSFRLSDGILIVSNASNSNGDTDVLLSKYDRADGQLLWQTTYDFQGQNDYGVKVVASENENGQHIYVIAYLGVSLTNSDIGVLKYDGDGNLIWDVSWDGNNGIDFPTDIKIDGDFLYVTGGSQYTNVYSDYITLKFEESDGTLIWENSYDNVALHDAAVSLTTRGNHVLVTGTSAASPTKWENTTVAYSKNTGEQIWVHRIETPGIGFDQPKALIIDDNDNIYITGYVIENGVKNIQLAQINSDFEVVWVEYYNASNDDEPEDIGIDQSGNIYISGFTTVNGMRDYLILKYSQSGTLQWDRTLRQSNSSFDGQATGVAISDNNQIWVTGTLQTNSGNTIKTVCFDTDGELLKIIDFDVSGEQYIQPKIKCHSDQMYITGLREIPNSRSQIALNYSVSNRELVPVYLDSVQSHVSGEIIIRFGREYVIPETINDKRITHGELSEFVTQQVLDSLQNIHPNVNWQKAKTYKIFKRLTMADSISITRTGSEIAVQPFWAVLLINVGSIDELEVIDSLQQRAFPLIHYAHTNDFIKLLTDDPFYGQQHSLFSSLYQDGHINVEDAWQFETGKPNIKVGVYDSGVRWNHQDFGGSSTFACDGCVVQGGYDYGISNSLEFTSNFGDPSNSSSTDNGHGTKVAGIIAAKRDNGIGVAGIAGGTAQNSGVSIYGFRAIGIGLTLEGVCEALVEGAISTTAGSGYGLHIMNNSWRRFTQYNDENPVDVAQTLMEDTHREIFKNQVVFVAARGNQTGTANYFPAHSRYPYWVLSVGGSDHLGNRHSLSGYGGNLDIIAPYNVPPQNVENQVYTTHSTSPMAYASLTGTSAATPHVSGVAALMLSHINDSPETPNNLTHDDVEFLINRYAKDRNYLTSPSDPMGNNQPLPIGYDQFTGHGLLDAGNVMLHIDKSEYIIKHVEFTTPVLNTGTQVLSGNYYFTGAEYVPRGWYSAQIYINDYQIPNNLLPGDIIENYWPLNSISNAIGFIVPYSSGEAYDVENGLQIISVNNEFTTVRTYVINLTQHTSGPNNGQNVNYWHPTFPGAPITLAYSLHIKSDYANIENNDFHAFTLSCFPNPTNENVNIEFYSQHHSNSSITIFDINGRLIHQFDHTSIYGKNIVPIDVSEWSKGLYLIRYKSNENISVVKFIKQ